MATRKTEVPIHSTLQGVLPPPESVTAVEAWAAGLNLRCALGLESASKLEAERLKQVAWILKCLARLKDKAARSEKALLLRELRLKEQARCEAPPIDDPAAIVLWSYTHLACLAHEAATDRSWRPKDKNEAIKALGAAGFMPCNAELKAIADRVKAT